MDCPTCGVVAEFLPWACGKHHLTTAYMQFLANWARKLSWFDVSRQFRTSWDQVYRSIEWVVQWGLERRVLGPIKAIGADEIAYSRGRKYLTLVYQIKAGMVRLLRVGKERTMKAFEGFFTMLGHEACAGIDFVCSDMWRPFSRVIRERCSHAVHILDRFHIVAKMNAALDDVRADEARAVERNGQEPVLKKPRSRLLKRSENPTTPEKGRPKELLRYNLKSVRAYLLKQDFQQLWEYAAPLWPGQFLDACCATALRPRIELTKKIARLCQPHRPLILSWLHAKGALSNGVVEGLNNKATLTIRRSYGFRPPDILAMASLHALGQIPNPQLTCELY